MIFMKSGKAVSRGMDLIRSLCILLIALFIVWGGSPSAICVSYQSLLAGENERWQPIQTSFAAHLKYSFQFRPNTCADRIYGGAYQGFGLSATTFGDKKQLGDPISFYVFQGRGLPGLIPVFRSTTNGTSVCPPVGNRMIMIIIPIMVQSVRE